MQHPALQIFCLDAQFIYRIKKFTFGKLFFLRPVVLLEFKNAIEFGADFVDLIVDVSHETLAITCHFSCIVSLG